MPETAELEQKSQSLIVQAQEVVAIETAERYTDAVQLGQALSSMRDGIEEFWSPLKKAAKLAHQNLCDEERKMLSPVEGCILSLKGRIRQYLDVEEAKRRETERIAQEAARKAQEEAAVRAAEALQAQGDHQGAEEAITEAIAAPMPPVIIQSTVPQVRGASIRSTWSYRIVDKAKIKPEYLEPAESKIGQVVRALKKHAEEAVGGIQVYEEKSVAMRSR